MAFQLTSDPVSDGSPAIFNAITYALYGMGVDCKQIGTFDNNGTFDNQTLCSDDLSPHPSTSTDLGEGLYTTTTYVQDRYGCRMVSAHPSTSCSHVFPF
jgi:hypothetical protein